MPLLRIAPNRADEPGGEKLPRTLVEGLNIIHYADDYAVHDDVGEAREIKEARILNLMLGHMDHPLMQRKAEDSTFNFYDITLPFARRFMGWRSHFPICYNEGHDNELRELNLEPLYSTFGLYTENRSWWKNPAMVATAGLITGPIVFGAFFALLGMARVYLFGDPEMAQNLDYPEHILKLTKVGAACGIVAGPTLGFMIGLDYATPTQSLCAQPLNDAKFLDNIIEEYQPHLLQHLE